MTPNESGIKSIDQVPLAGMMGVFPVPWRSVLLLLLMAALMACGQDKRLEQTLSLAQQRIQELEQAMTRGELRNARLIGQYAEKVASERPDLKEIIATLRQEPTKQGQLFKRLQRRIEQVRQLEASYGDPAVLLAEAQSIVDAADPAVFDMALADVVNVLADMSGGKLPRVGVIEKSRELGVNDAKDYGSGSQLVGNPNYGHWSNQGGTSFWEWYGMYSLFSNLTGGNRVYYNDWNRHRTYSFYQDRIADRYGSPLTRRKWGRNWSSSFQKSSGRDFSRPRKKSSFSRSAGTGGRTGSSRFGTSGNSKRSAFGAGSFRRSSSYRRGFRGGK